MGRRRAVAPVGLPRPSEKPFDLSMKDLTALDPGALLEVLGVPATGPVHAINPEIVAVSSPADGTILLREPSKGVVVVEFKSARDSKWLRKARLRHYTLEDREDCPALSVLAVQRREAMLSEWEEGLHEASWINGDYNGTFVFRTVRLWELPLQPLLSGPVAMLPLAPLTDAAAPQLEPVIDRIVHRLRRAPRDQCDLITALTFLLMGVRYSKGRTQELMRRIPGMEESSFYQLIKDLGRTEGRAEGETVGELRGARLLLREVAESRFGPPTEGMRGRIEAIDAIDQLRLLARRALQPDVTTWAQLINPRRPKGRDD